MNSKLASLVVALGIASCAVPAPGVGNHLSAADEEVAARADDLAAVEHYEAYDPAAVRFKEHCVGSTKAEDGLGECWYDRLNPTAPQLLVAREHRRAAAAHRATSSALRDAEARACQGVSEHDRDISPFAHRTDILDVTEVPQGAIVLFRRVNGMTAESLQRIVDCHLARNDALGHVVPWMLYCPLVPQDVKAKVTDVPQGLAVRVESSNAAAAREVKYRVGELITLE